LLAFGLASEAQSADMPRKAFPPPVAAEYNWTGFYVGGHIGPGWGSSLWTNATGVFTDGQLRHDLDGLLGGAQLGYNHQIGRWVIGVEGDFSWSNIEGTGIFDPTGGRDPVSVHKNWLASVTGRVGHTFGPWLAYAKGGGAWVEDRYRVTLTPLAGPPTAEVTKTNTGYTIGGGLEYGFLANWSARVEYDYYNFGTERVSFPPVPGFLTFPNFPLDISQHVHAVKFALNYRFR
jgi:outer membrane immunogenic protein